MKMVVGLFVGLLVGALMGFALGYGAEDLATKHAQHVAIWYADYTNCVDKIPRHAWPMAMNPQQDAAAKERAFELLGSMYDCGSTSGIGGRRLLDLGTYSGWSSVPLALRRPTH
jgi:hypothetical protein